MWVGEPDPALRFFDLHRDQSVPLAWAPYARAGVRFVQCAVRRTDQMPSLAVEQPARHEIQLQRQVAAPVYERANLSIVPDHESGHCFRSGAEREAYPRAAFGKFRAGTDMPIYRAAHIHVVTSSKQSRQAVGACSSRRSRLCTP